MAWSNGSCNLKFRKRDKVWRNSTESCTAYIETKKDLEARSYRHWLFLTNIKGLVVFNDYSYSTSTSGHQSSVRSLIKGKYKVDIFVNQHKSLDKGIDLIPFYETKLLCEVKLSKKGLSKKSRERIQKNLENAEDYISKILKFKICKNIPKKQLVEMKKEIESNEISRLERNKNYSRLERNKKNELKPELENLGPVNLENLENEMNDKKSINF